MLKPKKCARKECGKKFKPKKKHAKYCSRQCGDAVRAKRYYHKDD